MTTISFSFTIPDDMPEKQKEFVREEFSSRAYKVVSPAIIEAKMRYNQWRQEEDNKRAAFNQQKLDDDHQKELDAIREEGRLRRAELEKKQQAHILELEEIIKGYEETKRIVEEANRFLKKGSTPPKPEKTPAHPLPGEDLSSFARRLADNRNLIRDWNKKYNA